jgi:uncharacterized protein (TIGR02391 family)
MSDFELKFDPNTIEHLGVKMYATLPPALAELISNAYDADAGEVKIQFYEKASGPESITVIDTGTGMTADDIQEKFLVIGRNRRRLDGDSPSKKYKRLPTGKKGLGKLALFGLAKEITVDTVRNGLRNKFILDWDDLRGAEGIYKPRREIENQKVDKRDGTTIRLSELKRKSSFDLESIADSLSRIFIVDDNFRIKLVAAGSKKEEVLITNDRRYSQLKVQFSWEKEDFIGEQSQFLGKIDFKLFTTETPIPPSAGARGVTIFSRGKLVNAPEYFSISTSSHFFQYLTGWIVADFIDLLDEDVISTNRQAVNWDNQEMAEFRDFLSDIVAKVGRDWRAKRVKKNEGEIKSNLGIDTGAWMATMPNDVKTSVEEIVEVMTKDETSTENAGHVIAALHKIIPEYPLLHWRGLNSEIREASEKGYIGKDYYSAFLEAAKRYSNRVRDASGCSIEQDFNLMGRVFGGDPDKILKVASGYLRKNGTPFAPSTITNIEGAQQRLSQGVVEGGRNVVAHEEAIDLSVSGLFSEKDCLDMLSLISYLMNRVASIKSELTVTAE